MEKQVQIVRARVKPEEMHALEIMSQQECRNKSAMLREIIREAAARRGIEPLCFAVDYSGVVKPEVQFERP